MPDPPVPSPRLTGSDTAHPDMARTLLRIETVGLVIGLILTVIRRGLWETRNAEHWEIAAFVLLAALVLATSMTVRWLWSHSRRDFFNRHRAALATSLLWIGGAVALLIVTPALPGASTEQFPRATRILHLSELYVLIRGLIGLAAVSRQLSAEGVNPAVLLAASFLVVIGLGTSLLLLPQARSSNAPVDEPFPRRFQTALFTATSATCVTGLVVVPTGGTEGYWSPLGQGVILTMFQLGGLGIMTCGAFFAVAVGRNLEFRESAALQHLLESETLGNVRRLLVAIVAFTLLCESMGAVLLAPLWSHLEFSQQVFYSVFHSVSAFCNAGFTLTDDSFVSLRNRWQIWGISTALIVLGGLGFGVLYNVGIYVKSRLGRLTRPPLFDLSRERVRLTVSTKLVLLTSGILLVGGLVGFLLMESTHPVPSDSFLERLNAAWFQSVTYRTAGFNTVDHGTLAPATKLFAVSLMFVGASPGSTGGGIKTICLAVMILALVSILRGRSHVEFAGRTISGVQVNRALAILTLGVLTLMSTTLLLVIFEHRPDRFLDYLYEAASACATVGVSSSIEVDGERISITQSLSSASRNVVILAMYLGRIGPLTLLLAMAGRKPEVHYEYPTEQIVLG